MEAERCERGPVPYRSDSDDDLFLPSPSRERVDLGWGRSRGSDLGSVSSEECSTWSSDYRGEGDVNKHGATRAGRSRFDRQGSIVDGLLFEIYDRWHGRERDSLDSDTFTECSSTSEIFSTRTDSYQAAVGRRHARQLNRGYLEGLSAGQLRKMVEELTRSVTQVSARLVRQLKRRDRRLAKLQRHSDVVTAVLQASSQKRRIDTRMRFSLEPPMGESAFDQWRDAMKAVARLPLGIPPEFRRKVWLSLADNYIKDVQVDWEKTVRFTFNEKSNPDDDRLGLQIVKDLHRTGCSSFSGQDNEEERAVLKRVLLAYARWNKSVGYCQGFNVIAALLLNVTDRKEDDALKVMIYLIDKVLPESYFDNNLRALSVDMAVFRDLLRITFPPLARHLDHLQNAAQDSVTGGCYEPPLTNVFTMQWFLTLFATCLPKSTVLRVWDSILLEGSEILLRTALAIWGRLSRRIMTATSADEFYTLMGELSADMLDGRMFDGDEFVKAIYSVAPSPFPQLTELREKYTYNIRPFTSGSSASKKASHIAKATVLFNSDEDDLDDDDIEAIRCFPGILPLSSGKGRGGEGDMGAGTTADFSALGPGAFGSGMESGGGSGVSPVYQERMSTDITSLSKQYHKLRLRQRQAHIIIAAASARCQQKSQMAALVPKIQSPTAMNHLFVGKRRHTHSSKNRVVTEGPCIGITHRQAGSRRACSTTDLRMAPSSPLFQSSRLGKSGAGSSGDVPPLSKVGLHTLGGLSASEVTPFAKPKEESADSRLAEEESSGDAKAAAMASEIPGSAESRESAEICGAGCEAEATEAAGTRAAEELTPSDKEPTSLCPAESTEEEGRRGEFPPGEQPADTSEMPSIPTACHADALGAPGSLDHTECPSSQDSTDLLCGDQTPMSDCKSLAEDASGGVVGLSEGLVDREVVLEREEGLQTRELGLADGEVDLDERELDLADRKVELEEREVGLLDREVGLEEIWCCSQDSSVQGGSVTVGAAAVAASPAVGSSEDVPRNRWSIKDTAEENARLSEKGAVDKTDLESCETDCCCDLPQHCKSDALSADEKKNDHHTEILKLVNPVIPTNEENAMTSSHGDDVISSDTDNIPKTVTKSCSDVSSDENTESFLVSSAGTDQHQSEAGITNTRDAFKSSSSSCLQLSLCRSEVHSDDSISATSVSCSDNLVMDLSPGHHIPTQISDPGRASVSDTVTDGTAASLAVLDVGCAADVSSSVAEPATLPEAPTEERHESSDKKGSPESETIAKDVHKEGENSAEEKTTSSEDVVTLSHSQGSTPAPCLSVSTTEPSRQLNGCLVRNGSVTSTDQPRSEKSRGRHVSFSEPETDSEWTPSDSASRSQKSRNRLGGSSTSPTPQDSTHFMTKFVYVTSKRSSHHPANQRSLSSVLSSPTSPTSPPAKPFNPFPMRHVNQNRAKTGVKLGLYSASTLQQLGQGLRKAGGKDKVSKSAY